MRGPRVVVTRNHSRAFRLTLTKDFQAQWPRPLGVDSLDPLVHAGCGCRAAAEIRADGEIRTLTDDDLNVVPLPIGLRRRSKRSSSTFARTILASEENPTGRRTYVRHASQPGSSDAGRIFAGSAQWETRSRMPCVSRSRASDQVASRPCLSSALFSRLHAISWSIQR